MARNKVVKLWTAIVTAFLALCTTLGFVTRTSAPAVLQTEPERNSERIPHQRTASVTPPASQAKALPPTMKQRIRAEAHGKTPLPPPPAHGRDGITRRPHRRGHRRGLRPYGGLLRSPAALNPQAIRTATLRTGPAARQSRRASSCPARSLVTQKTPNRYRLGVHHAGGANRI